MKSLTKTTSLPTRALWLTLLLCGASVLFAQTPVDEDGNPIGTVPDASGDRAAADTFTAAELETLVGPIALYPDDLLAIVLPASTYPLEIVQAARYLERLEDDSNLEPDPDWDDSVVALLNYPEVVHMMNDDLDWTWQLGEAVIAQQDGVVAAVEAFRDQAYAAGNLQSDERQSVTRNDDAIEIAPAEEDVIYVPYYEPAQVVVRQPRRVYYYYPRPYPVYYYPYPAGHHFVSGYFWGVTTAFRIGWLSNHLHVYHHSFHGHPYFGWNYYGSYWRRPSIHVFNTYYGYSGYRSPDYRYRHGSFWRPRHHRGGARPGHYRDARRSRSDDGYAREQRANRADSRTARRIDTNRPGSAERRSRTRATAERRGARPATGGRRGSAAGRSRGDGIEFRDRPDNPARQTRRRAAAPSGDDTAIRFRNRTATRPASAQPGRATLRTGRERVADDGARRQAVANGRRLTTPRRPRSQAPTTATRQAPAARAKRPDSASSGKAAPRGGARRPAAALPRATPQRKITRSAPQRQSRAPAPQRSRAASRASSPPAKRSSGKPARRAERGVANSKRRTAAAGNRERRQRP